MQLKNRFSSRSLDDKSVNCARLSVDAVNVNAGKHSAVIYTTDLTADYVHEDSAYST